MKHFFIYLCLCFVLLNAASAEVRQFILVLDTSGSMGSTDPHQHRQVAAELLISLAQKGDEVGVVYFNDSVVRSQMLEITSNRVKFEARKVTQTPSASGGTDYISALRHTLNLINRPGTQIIFVSDGQPNTSQGLDDLVAQIKKRGGKIHTIGLGMQAQSPEAQILGKMALGTGGSFTIFDDPSHLIEAMANISGAARNFLRLKVAGTILNLNNGIGGGQLREVRELIVICCQDNIRSLRVNQRTCPIRQIDGQHYYYDSANRMISLVYLNDYSPGLYQFTTDNRRLDFVFYRPEFEIDLENADVFVEVEPSSGDLVVSGKFNIKNISEKKLQKLQNKVSMDITVSDANGHFAAKEKLPGKKWHATLQPDGNQQVCFTVPMKTSPEQAKLMQKKGAQVKTTITSNLQGQKIVQQHQNMAPVKKINPQLQGIPAVIDLGQVKVGSYSRPFSFEIQGNWSTSASLQITCTDQRLQINTNVKTISNRQPVSVHIKYDARNIPIQHQRQIVSGNIRLQAATPYNSQNIPFKLTLVAVEKLQAKPEKVIDFGKVTWGQSKEQILRILGNLSFSSKVYGRKQGNFPAKLYWENRKVKSGCPAELRIIFDTRKLPPVPGRKLYSCMLSFKANGYQGSLRISVKAVVELLPKLSISPDSIDFGDILMSGPENYTMEELFCISGNLPQQNAIQAHNIFFTDPKHRQYFKIITGSNNILDINSPRCFISSTQPCSLKLMLLPGKIPPKLQNLQGDISINVTGYPDPVSISYRASVKKAYHLNLSISQRNPISLPTTNHNGRTHKFKIDLDTNMPLTRNNLSVQLQEKLTGQRHGNQIKGTFVDIKRVGTDYCECQIYIPRSQFTFRNDTYRGKLMVKVKTPDSKWKTTTVGIVIPVVIR